MAAAWLKAGSGAGAQLPWLPGTSRATHGSPNVGIAAVPSPVVSEQPGGVWGWMMEMPGQCLFPGSVVGSFWAEKPLTEEEDGLSRFIPWLFSS